MALNSAPTFILDYTLDASYDTPFTFQGDTTYYVNGEVFFTAGITLEGGAVIKMNGDDWSGLTVYGGDIVCRTSPYRPVVFTSKDDDTIGEVLPNSTGSPGLPYAGGIALNVGTEGAVDLRHLRFAYSWYAMAFDGYGLTIDPYQATHVQFAHAAAAIVGQLSSVRLGNALMYDVEVGFLPVGYGDFHVSVEHLTVNACNSVGDDWLGGNSSLAFTNCLFAAIGSIGNIPYVADSLEIAEPEETVFASAGAGAHYLPENSPYRDAGTDNISPALAAELQQRTTHAPFVYPSNSQITATTTLTPTAARATGRPDLGYHYAPLDYVSFGLCITNQATVRLAPGVVMGMLGYNTLWFADNSSLICEGTPLQRNQFVRCAAVQENGTWGNGYSYAISLYHPQQAEGPLARFRFTDFNAMNGEWIQLWAGYEAWSYRSLSFQDCAFYGATLSLDAPANMVCGITNTLFHRTTCWIDGDMPFGFFNNLVRGGLDCAFWPFNTNNFILCDNIFWETPVWGQEVVGSHNAYMAIPTPDNRLFPTNETDMVLSNFTFVPGPLGNFYLPSNSVLIDAGSRSAADAGLYHFTTQLSQEKEADSLVDIGAHYVALNGEALAVDTDGDGLPDYLEDSNGDGVYQSTDLSNFASDDSDGDGLLDPYELSATQTDPRLADTGNTGTTDGYKDPDGDGWTNLEEASLGTDPLHSNVGSLAFSPVGGAYATAQNVAVTCPTAGATIHYTVNGAEPTEAAPTIASGSTVSIVQNTTLKARAWKTDWTPSDTESQGYEITDTPTNQPPVLTVSPPSGLTVAASDDIEILVEASDPDGTISRVQLYRGSYKVAETTDSPLRYLLKKVTAGSHTFTAKAIDNAGAVTVSSPITIIVGDSGPVVALVGAQPFFTSSPGTLLANIIGVNPGALTGLTLNGTPLVPRAGQFSLTVPLAEGENTFTLVATDNLSRSGQATAQVYLDSVPPTISITAPANNASFNTDRVNVQGTFTETSFKRITVNGVLAFTSGNTFEALNVPLAEGANTITATAEDIAGNETSASITVTGSATPVDPVQLQAAPVGGFAPLQVTFTPSANVPGTIQQVLYDFTGDQTTFQTATDLNPVTHTYTAAGQYFPVVTIQTTAGRFSSLGGWNAGPWGARLRVNVQEPPVVVSTINVTDPVDLKWMPGGHLYVLSRSTATLTEYDSAGAVVRSLVNIGNTPTGLDVDASGHVYVALSGENKVARFIPTETSFQLDTSFNGTGYIGSAGSGDGQFNTPFDVAVTPDGTEIAVSDSGNHRIQVFTSAGTFQSAFGQFGSELGQFNAPKGLAFDAVGTLRIVDSGNNRVVAGDTSDFRGAFGTPGSGLGQFQAPLNLAVGTRGVYVADTGNSRIQALDLNTEGAQTPFIARFVLSTDVGLNQPQAVSAVEDLLEEKLYIADTGNNRVVLVRLPADNPEAVWNAMKQRLITGDISGAILYFSSVSAERYRNQFFSLGASSLIALITPIPPITPVFVHADTAQYRFERVVQGYTITFPIEFTKENGTWKIVEY